MQGCPLLAVYLPVVLHVGVVLVEPEGQVEDGVRGPLLGHLREPLGQAAAQVQLQVLRVHAAGHGQGVPITPRGPIPFCSGSKLRTRWIKGAGHVTSRIGACSNNVPISLSEDRYRSNLINSDRLNKNNNKPVTYFCTTQPETAGPDHRHRQTGETELVADSVFMSGTKPSRTERGTRML